MDYLNVVSLIVRGLHNGIKRNSIYRWLKDNKYHIRCIQESFCTQANIAQFKKGWDGEIYHSLSNSTHSRGVSIMLSKHLNCNVVSFHKGFQIRSRAKYVEQGEKSTKYFLGLEKQRQNSKLYQLFKNQ